MFIDVSKFFDFDVADEHIGYDGKSYYDILLASKSTGEVITLTFDEVCFNELLNQMEENIKAKQKVLEILR